MGKRMPELCWAVFKRRAINLRDWCIWLVDLFECMVMHGLTNPKFNILVLRSDGMHHFYWILNNATGWLVLKKGLNLLMCNTLHPQCSLNTAFSCLTLGARWFIYIHIMTHTSITYIRSLFYIFCYMFRSYILTIIRYKKYRPVSFVPDDLYFSSMMMFSVYDRNM